MRELVAERVSAAEAKAAATTNNNNAAKVPAVASSALQQQNRPTKVLKREPIRVRLPEGRGVVSAPLTAEECRRQAREARRGLEQMKAAREMAENKAERQRDGEWAKKQEDQHTPEEREREEEEADALHERLLRETPSRRTMSAR